MNNKQTLFSVRVNKEDFLIKAKEAYEQYSKLSKQNLEESDACATLGALSCMYSENYLYYKGLSKRVMNTINMVNISSDELVDVTEDIYTLIYKYDS